MVCLRHTPILLFVISILGSASALSIASKKHLQSRGEYSEPLTLELVRKAKEGQCGYSYVMSDGRAVVDMPEGSIANCTATRAILQFFIDNWAEIGPEKLEEYMVDVGTWTFTAPFFNWQWSGCRPSAPAKDFSGRVASECVLPRETWEVLYEHELLGETVDKRTVANLFNALLIIGTQEEDMCKQSGKVSADECREWFDFSLCSEFMQLYKANPKVTGYYLGQTLGYEHQCGKAQTLPDGRKIVDMPYGTPSTCKGTFEVLHLLNDKFEEIGDDKLNSWFNELKEMSDPKHGTIKSLEALWDLLPKSSSGLVSTDDFLPRIGLETAFPTSFSKTDLSNYIHALFEIGYKAGVPELNTHAEWSGIFKPTKPISWPVTNRTLLKTLTHGCGFPQTLADGSVIVDMRLGTPSTCKGTYDIVRALNDNYQTIGDAQLTEWVYGVKELAEKYESLEALWEKLPKSSSGEVLCADVKTYTGASMADLEEGAKLDFLGASNYIHAILEIGGEAGILEPYAIAEWAGTLKPMSSKVAPVQLNQQKS